MPSEAVLSPSLILILTGAGIAIGFALGWALALRRTAAEKQLNRRLLTEKAVLEANLENERKTTAEKIALLESAESRLKESFKALSADSLKENQSSFLGLLRPLMETIQKEAVGDLDSRRKAVDELVAPMTASLQKVEKKLDEVEKARTSSYAALREQVEIMAGTQKELHSETTRLVQALKAPTSRGRWGEIQLRRVVEMAGMLEHCDFTEQDYAGPEEARLRPDMIIRLPGGKNVVVDAKAPLGAYLEAMEATEEGVRKQKLEEHGKQVRDRIANLGRKSYWSQFDPSPEFVIMFLPGEMLFSAALQSDPGLIEYGIDRYVIPASPTTLIALLRAVHYGWQQEKVAENAMKIRDLGRELHERIRTMAEHFGDLQRNLDRTVGSYNKTIRSFESRVLVSARKFKELGAGSGDEIEELPEIEERPRD